MPRKSSQDAHLSSHRICPKCKKNRMVEATAKQCGQCYRERGLATQPLCPICRKNRIRKSSTQCQDCYLDRVSKTQSRKEEKRRLLEDRAVADLRAYVRENPPQRILRPKVKKAPKAQSHEMVLLFSDAHYPEVVEPTEALGLSYGPDVCKRRIEHIRDTVIRYKDLRSTSYPVRKLTIADLGDQLSGDIHEELEITNASPVSEALVNFAYMAHDLASSLAEEFPEVEYIKLCGNHPRLTKKPRNKGKWNNWEYVLGHFLKALAGDSYKVVVPKALLYQHQVFNTHMGFLHGDGSKAGGFAGIPWYGLKRRQDAMQALLSRLGNPRLDYLCMGHFHVDAHLQGTDCDLIINGSIKGGDEYSLVNYHDAKEPRQALLTFHPAHRLTDKSIISLGHIT